MPFVHGKGAYFKVASTDLSADLNSISISRTAETAETSAFGSTSKTYVAGLKDASITLSGMFNTSDYSTIAAWQGTSQTFEFGPSGSGAGGVKVSGSAIITSVEMAAAVGAVVTLNLNLQVTGAVTDGTFA